MRLCTIRQQTGDDVAIAIADRVLTLSHLNQTAGTQFGPTLLDLIRNGETTTLRTTIDTMIDTIPDTIPDTWPSGPVPPLDYAPIYRNPPQLWGVGLNYGQHADDLGVCQPTGAPGSYLRPCSTIIGHGDDILLPHQSHRVTAEAELGVVIGTTCRDVPAQNAASVIIGYTPVLDMTAEDAIRANPRHIPWAKAFDTFCSLGPWIVTPDEIPDLPAVRISTIINGHTIASNHVSCMTYDPHWLVSYFCAGRTLHAGSIIATGTPGAGQIHPGDTVEAHIDGIGQLHNTVRPTT